MLNVGFVFVLTFWFVDVDMLRARRPLDLGGGMLSDGGFGWNSVKDFALRHETAGFAPGTSVFLGP